MNDSKPILVLGGTGKTGRRVVERLSERWPARAGATPSSETRFAWEDQSTWAPALEGTRAIYLAYYEVAGRATPG